MAQKTSDSLKMSELKDLVSNFYKSCQLCLIKKPEDEDFQNILGTFLKNKVTLGIAYKCAYKLCYKPLSNINLVILD